MFSHNDCLYNSIDAVASDQVSRKPCSVTNSAKRGAKVAKMDCGVQVEDLCPDGMDGERLQDSVRTLVSVYREQETRVKTSRDRLFDQMEVVSEMSEAFRWFREICSMEQQRFWQEVESLDFVLSARDDECSILNEEVKRLRQELDQQKKHHNRLVSDLVEVRSQSKQLVGLKDERLRELKDENWQMRTKMVTLVREKDILWKKTQSLYNSLQTSERWMSDKEVDHCCGCNAKFSFFLRKHHCRSCGKIFCNSCSCYCIEFSDLKRKSKVRVCSDCRINHKQPQAECVESTFSSEFSLEHEHEARFSKSCLEIQDFMFYPNSSLKPDVEKSQDSSEGRFDVITDDEIAKSLSASSPYSRSLELSALSLPELDLNPDLQLCFTRCSREIEVQLNGIHGEAWISAGHKYGLPILVDTPFKLMWELSSSSKGLSYWIAFKKNLKSQESVTCRKEVQLKDYDTPVRGELDARDSGVYIIMFNCYSKFIATKLKYHLKTRCISAED